MDALTIIKLIMLVILCLTIHHVAFEATYKKLPFVREGGKMLTKQDRLLKIFYFLTPIPEIALVIAITIVICAGIFFSVCTLIDNYRKLPDDDEQLNHK